MKLRTVIGVAALAMAGAASAAQSGLIMTTFGGNGQTVLQLELDNSNKLAAMDLAIELPGVKKSQVNLSKCASGLSAMSACNFKDGVLYISAASVEPFNSGVIGFVTIEGAVSVPKVATDKSNFFTDQKQVVSAEVLNDSQPMSKWVMPALEHQK